MHSASPLLMTACALLTPLACSDDNDPLSILSDTLGGTSVGVTSSDEASTGATTEPASDPTGGAENPDIPVCNPADDLEPNDIEDEASVLDNINDQDASGSLVDSILAGDQDVDWFAYQGYDIAFAYVDPAGTLSTDMDLRLCLFVECMIGTTPPPTCLGSVYEESPDGRVGCCDTGANAAVEIDLTCPGANDDDSAYVFMRVDRGRKDLCIPYDLEYHF